jgi:uncharacterized membrane protein YbhN (UPF0104 family)
MSMWSRHQVHTKLAKLGLLTLAAALLFVGAAVGMAYVAGFDGVRHALEQPSWPWLVASLGGVALSFVGYYFGYRGLASVEDGPDDLDLRSRLAIVVAGFGGFLAHGGGALDEFVMRAAGASKREARVRVTLLAGLEHGMLSVPCTVAAVVLVATGRHKPGFDFSIPWVVGPAVGFAIAFWAAERYRERYRDADGWRERLGVLLDAIHLVRTMVFTPRTSGPALAAFVLYWITDIFALWAGMAAFGFHMNLASATVAFGTAMIVTRRTGPLGGAGILMVALPPTLWVSGAPWTPAVLGTFAYRVFTLWLPMPASFYALPTLRTLGERAADTPGEGTALDKKEPALQH